VLCSLQAQQTDEFRSKDAIARNKVKYQFNWDYKYEGNKPSKTGIKTSVTTFNNAGDAILVNAFNPKGAILHTEKYRYDARGNKIEYTRQSGDNSYQKRYSYNDKNLVIAESGFDGVEKFRNEYSYAKDGSLMEIRYMKDSLLSEKRVFAKSGQITTVSIYNRNGVLTSKLVLKHDSHNNLIEESLYGANQNALEKKTYNYDDKENLKEEARYKLDKITLKTTYSYNASGNLVEVAEQTADMAKFVKKSMVYDSQGNLLEIQWRRKASDEFNQIRYVYDSRGLCVSANTYYPATGYRVLTRYVYEFY
jgi:hypothetical protein